MIFIFAVVRMFSYLVIFLAYLYLFGDLRNLTILLEL